MISTFDRQSSEQSIVVDVFPVDLSLELGETNFWPWTREMHWKHVQLE